MNNKIFHTSNDNKTIAELCEQVADYRNQLNNCTEEEKQTILKNISQLQDEIFDMTDMVNYTRKYLSCNSYSTYITTELQERDPKFTSISQPTEIEMHAITQLLDDLPKYDGRVPFVKFAQFSLKRGATEHCGRKHNLTDGDNNHLSKIEKEKHKLLAAGWAEEDITPEVLSEQTKLSVATILTLEEIVKMSKTSELIINDEDNNNEKFSTYHSNPENIAIKNADTAFLRQCLSVLNSFEKAVLVSFSEGNTFTQMSMSPELIQVCKNAGFGHQLRKTENGELIPETVLRQYYNNSIQKLDKEAIAKHYNIKTNHTERYDMSREIDANARTQAVTAGSLIFFDDMDVATR